MLGNSGYEKCTVLYDYDLIIINRGIIEHTTCIHVMLGNTGYGKCTAAVCYQGEYTLTMSYTIQSNGYSCNDAILEISRMMAALFFI